MGSATTGGLGGFDCIVTDPQAGTLTVQTPLLQFSIPIAAIGLDDIVYAAGGLARQIRVSRLPDVTPIRTCAWSARSPYALLGITHSISVSRKKMGIWPGRARSMCSINLLLTSG